MPPPLLASATFSFQVPTMPSSESDTSLRKQEIGRPRLVPPLDRIGRGRHEPQPAHIVVQPLGVGHVIGIGAGDAGEHVLEAFARHQVAVGQGRLAERGQQGVAGVVQHQVGRLGARRQRIRQRRLGRLLEQVLDRLGRFGLLGRSLGSGLVSTVRVTTTDRSSTRSGGVWTTTWPSVSKSPSRTCLPSADIYIPLGGQGNREAVGARYALPYSPPGRPAPIVKPCSRQVSWLAALFPAAFPGAAPVALGRKISRLQLRGQPRFRPHQAAPKFP